MADQESQTEEASQRRLDKAYEEGQVPVGRDAVAVASLCAGAAALVSVAPEVRDGLVHLMATAFASAASTPFKSLALLGLRPFGLALAACACAPLAAVVVTIAQTRAGFWPERVFPDFSKLFEPSRVGRLFKREFLVDLLLATVKVVALGAVMWAALRADFLTLARLFGAAPAKQLAGIFNPLWSAVLRALGAMAVLAGAELALTRYRFAQRMKMTREETRRESREDEGDPLIKSRRRRRHRELSKARVAQVVPRADLLLVNPTHIAIALRYRRSESRAPKVTAKGKGALAEIMRDIARSNGIPIVQDIPLARLLYRKVKIDREIPADTYKAVAAVLAFVYRLTGKTPGGAGADA